MTGGAVGGQVLDPRLGRRIAAQLRPGGDGLRLLWPRPGSLHARRVGGVHEPAVLDGLAHLFDVGLAPHALAPDASGRGDEARRLPTAQRPWHPPYGLGCLADAVERLVGWGTTHVQTLWPHLAVLNTNPLQMGTATWK